MQRHILLPLRRAFAHATAFYWGQGIADDVPALSYYLVLSLAPFTLGLGTIATLIFGAHLQATDIAHAVARFLPASVRGNVVQLVLTTKHDSARLLVLAVLAMLWTSSGAIGVIERCLARLTGATRYPVVWGKLRNVALGGSLCLLLVFVVALASLAGGLREYIPHQDALVLGVLLWVLDIVGATFFCVLIFRFGVRGGVGWRAALSGALPTAFMLQLTPLLVGFYFSFFARAAAASIFLSFAVVLLGCFGLALGFLIGVGVCAKTHNRLVAAHAAILSTNGPEHEQ
jgi:uncharacterized BrkB/YihY/UPF0761 family membrane protein